MRIVFKAKHWQIFGILISVGLLHAILRSIDPVASAIMYIILITINIGWILMLGIGLTKHSQNPNPRQFILFIGTGILLIAVTSILRLLIALNILVWDTEATELNRGLLLYLILSLAILYTYTAKTLKSFEIKEDIDINDYFADIFRLLFWPIGIWTIQPRINKIAIE